MNGKANERQVGGEHYKTDGLQHWDLFGPDYLIGYATKYMRWRKKGGVQDLLKAIHVVEKLREVLPYTTNQPKYDYQKVTAWCEAAGLDWTEKRIVHLIMFSQGRKDLDEAISGIEHLIENCPKQSDFDGKPKFVGKRIKTIADVLRPRTPEDGGQHASLTPWVTTREWLDGQKIDELLIDAFWNKRGSAYILDACVVHRNLPRVLKMCYTLNADANAWLLNMSLVPEDARDYFPDLHREKNTMELEELPKWQQELYEWNENGNKYELMSRFAAWHVEEE